MKSLRLAILWILLAGVVLGAFTPTPAAAASNGRQITFKVTGGYKLVEVAVYGHNQYPNTLMVKWTPPDSTGTVKSWQNGKCEYGAFSVCPDSVSTNNWWWVGDTVISFKAVHWYDTNDMKTGSCQVNVPKESIFSVMTVTYDPKTNTCSAGL